MISSNRIAEIAAVISDPARVNMLMSLKADRQMTAGDLALAANIAPSTASEHLARMRSAGVLAQRKDGRRRYYFIVDRKLADVLDAIVGLAESQSGADRPVPLAQLHTRLCYDHLAGRLACDLTAGLFDRGVLKHVRSGLSITRDGKVWLASLGVDAAGLTASPRVGANLCKDWTEDGYHVGGGLGSALLAVFRQRDWIRTRRGSVEVEITPIGRSSFRTLFGIDTASAPS